jgi:iron(III) transport system permease protein
MGRARGEERGLPLRGLRRPVPRLRVPRAHLGGVTLVLVIGVVTVGPLLWVLVSSFNAADPGRPFDFSFTGWTDVVGDSRTLSSIGYSFLLSLRIPIALAVATVMAWALIRLDIPARRFIENSLWLAFFLPALPITLGWILLLDGRTGLINELFEKLPLITGPILSINSVPGIMWVHVSLSTIPIMVILLAPALRQIDASYDEASQVAGASERTTLRRVILPLLAPAILTAGLAGFIKSLEVFEIEQLLGKPVGIYVYATRVYELVNNEPALYQQASALGGLFLGLLLIVATLYQVVLKRLGSQATVTGRGVSFRRRPRTPGSYVISGVMLVYLCIGVFLPLIVLLLGSFNKLFGFFFIDSPWTTVHWSEVLSSSEFRLAGVNSLIVGLGAAGVGTLLYALLAWVLVRTRIWGKGAITILVWLPWAVPGLLVGIAWLVIFLRVPVVSALYGTLVPLVLVLIIKELPLGTLMLRSAVQQISGELEEAAAVSGSSFVTTFRRITLPLISPMLVSVFMVVFMMTLRDIGTVVLVAPPDARTLPLLMFEYASAGRLGSGAVIGVMMAGAATLITLVAIRAGLKLNIAQEE